MNDYGRYLGFLRRNYLVVKLRSQLSGRSVVSLNRIPELSKSPRLPTGFDRSDHELIDVSKSDQLTGA